MNRLKKIYRIYGPFTQSVLQMKMSYKLDFFMSIVGQLIKCLIVYYLWRAVFLNASSRMINGFTSTEIIAYVFMSTITANIVSNSVDVTIGGEVWDGSISMNLIKPINYEIKLFFESIAELLQGTLIISLPIWIGFICFSYFCSSEVPPNIKTILFYLLSSFLGFLILFLFNFIFGVFSFYVTNIWGIRNLKYALLEFLTGSVIPLAFLPTCVQIVINFVPFASINYIPVMIYLKKITGYELYKSLGIQLIWIITLYFIGVLVWNKAIKRLSILGG